MKLSDADLAYLKHLSWFKGEISWKSRPHQERLYQFIRETQDLKTVICCARQFGKTFTVCLYLTEFCIKNPGCQIRYAAITEKALKKIIRPNMRIVLQGCPDALRPRWNQQESAYIFPNGSEWHLAGLDSEDAREKLRGTYAHIAIVDEAGFATDLEYVEKDIFLPQVQETDGRMIFISTRPRIPDHRFDKLAEEAEARGAYLEQTVDDNTHLTPIKKARLMEAAGGEDSITWQVEYLCKKVRDPQRLIVPEFSEAVNVREPPPEKHFNPIVGIDIGFKHFSAALFGYHWFKEDALVILDELLLKQAPTDVLAQGIIDRERALWGDRQVYGRWSDTDPRFIEDCAVRHKLTIVPTRKDNLEAQVNALRIDVKRGKVIIHPRCTQLIAHLKNGRWNTKRTDFDESDEYGHYDAVAALIYLFRNTPRNLNPYPAIPEGVSRSTHFIPASMVKPADPLAAALLRKKR